MKLMLIGALGLSLLSCRTSSEGSKVSGDSLTGFDEGRFIDAICENPSVTNAVASKQDFQLLLSSTFNKPYIGVSDPKPDKNDRSSISATDNHTHDSRNTGKVGPAYNSSSVDYGTQISAAQLMCGIKFHGTNVQFNGISLATFLDANPNRKPTSDVDLNRALASMYDSADYFVTKIIKKQNPNEFSLEYEAKAVGAVRKAMIALVTLMPKSQKALGILNLWAHENANFVGSKLRNVDDVFSSQMAELQYFILANQLGATPAKALVFATSQAAVSETVNTPKAPQTPMEELKDAKELSQKLYVAHKILHDASSDLRTNNHKISGHAVQGLSAMVKGTNKVVRFYENHRVLKKFENTKYTSGTKIEVDLDVGFVTVEPWIFLRSNFYTK